MSEREYSVDEITELAKQLPPDLPPERFDALAFLTSIYRTGDAIEARRWRFGSAASDSIQLTARSGCVDVRLTLTPAMIAHLANTVLTDNERAAINFAPALAGGNSE
jgi:hypothetical protein